MQSGGAGTRKHKEGLNGSGGTSVRSPFAHEGATAVYTGGDARDLTTTVRRVSIRELPYLRRGVTLVASGQSELEEGGFPGRAYVSEEDPHLSIRPVVRLSTFGA